MCIGAALMVLFIGAGRTPARVASGAAAGRIVTGEPGRVVRGGESSAGANRALITASIMLATIMQGVDNTIANVALPHMQGSLSATQDQIAWVLTSYMVSAAIMMPLTGWLAGQFGIKYVFLVSVLGFTVFSALAGSSTSLTQLVIYRIGQGICGAALVPLSQSVLLSINPPERHGPAMAVWGMGVMLGPIMGPAVGGWLTEYYNWRWVFYINLPVGLVAAIGILLFIPYNRPNRREPFDFFGFLMLSLALGGVQLMLDRGAPSGLVQLDRDLRRGGGRRRGAVSVRRPYGDRDRPLVSQPRPAEKPEFRHRHHADVPDRRDPQRHARADPDDAAASAEPSGHADRVCHLAARFRDDGRDVHRRTADRQDRCAAVDPGRAGADRGVIVADDRLLAADGDNPVLLSGLLQGFGLGCTFVPMNTLALSTLPRHLLTQGTAMRAVMRNVGGSIGVSMLVGQLTDNAQAVHSRLVEHLRPDNPLAHPALLPLPFSLTDPRGLAALNAEVSRQAEMIAYINDFALMMALVIAAIPLLLLVRGQAKVQ